MTVTFVQYEVIDANFREAKHYVQNATQNKVIVV